MGLQKLAVSEPLIQENFKTSPQYLRPYKINLQRKPPLIKMKKMGVFAVCFAVTVIILMRVM